MIPKNLVLDKTVTIIQQISILNYFFHFDLLHLINEYNKLTKTWRTDEMTLICTFHIQCSSFHFKITVKPVSFITRLTVDHHGLN